MERMHAIAGGDAPASPSASSSTLLSTASASSGGSLAAAAAAAAGSPSGASRGTSSSHSEIPEGWEEEYAAMTPQRANPAALRQRGVSHSPLTRPPLPSPLPQESAGRSAAVTGVEAGGGVRRPGLTVPTAGSATRSGAERGSRGGTQRSGGGGGHIPRHLLHEHYHRQGEGSSPVVTYGDEIEDDNDNAYDYDDNDNGDDDDDNSDDGDADVAGRGGGGSAGMNADDGVAAIDRSVATRHGVRRSGSHSRREPPNALDPAMLRRIQDFVPAHLLDNVPPEAMIAAGNLDIDDIMVMEALWLSLQAADERDGRPDREAAAAAAEEAEVAEAIAQVAAAEAAEAVKP